MSGSGLITLSHGRYRLVCHFPVGFFYFPQETENGNFLELLCPKWPQIYFVCHSHSQSGPFLVHGLSTGAVRGTGTGYPSGASEFTPGF
jgi:hypothetical protein